MPRRALTVCSRPGCPNLTESGRCAGCRAEAEQARGSARQRGYGKAHEDRFRKGVLERDVVCVLGCGRLATVADHWPLSRRQLVERGLDPDDPGRGRGLCASCHGSETSVNQPGGWNAQQ
jgi:5-methylcytosine-specific restriction protein A